MKTERERIQERLAWLSSFEQVEAAQKVLNLRSKFEDLQLELEDRFKQELSDVRSEQRYKEDLLLKSTCELFFRKQKIDEALWKSIES